VLLMLAVGTLISAVASSLWLMILGRVIQGAGGGIFPLAFSIIRDEFPNERVPGAIGLVSSLLGIGGGAGVVFAGIVTENLSYHWLFWFPLAIIVFTAYLTWRYIPESPVKTPGVINYRAAGLMTVGISAVLLAITETSTWGWGSPKTLGLLALGLLVIAAWVREELRSREPLRFEPAPWPFARERRVDIDAHFTRLRVEKPEIWNGRVLLMRRGEIQDGVLAGAYLETDFASFIAWRDWGFPDTTVRNCFAMAALRSSSSRSCRWCCTCCWLEVSNSDG